MKSFAAAIAAFLVAGIAAIPAGASQAPPPERARADAAYATICPQRATSTNHPPEVRAITIRRTGVANTYTIAVNARDPDRDELAYLFMVTDGTLRITGATATWTVSGPGQFTVIVTIDDRHGCSVTGSISTAAAARP